MNDDRDTLPPALDEYSEQGDLLASAIIQLDLISADFKRLSNTMRILLNSVRSHGLRLADHEKRITSLESEKI
jgi:hypothetical protein